MIIGGRYRIILFARLVERLVVNTGDWGGGRTKEKRAAFLLRDDYYDDNNNNNIVKFLRDSFESPSFLANFNCQCFERRPSFRPFRVYIYIRFNFAKYEIKEKEEGDTPGVFRVR